MNRILILYHFLSLTLFLLSLLPFGSCDKTQPNAYQGLTTPASYSPHKITFAELSLPTKRSSKTFSDALTKIGLISVTHIPGFSDLRKTTLVAASQCALGLGLGLDWASDINNGIGSDPLSEKSQSQSHNYHYLFEDGTHRYTLGTKTEDGTQHAVNGPGNVDEASVCAEFNRVEPEFRSLVDKVGKLFVARLDDMQVTKLGAIEPHGGGHGHNQEFRTSLLQDATTNEFYETFGEVVAAGTQLEHFHTYSKSQVSDLSSIQQSASKTKYTIETHTDHGLFIALTPALFVSPQISNDGDDHGFYVELPSGELVQPNFGRNGDELVFMIGDGVAQHLNPNLPKPLRAVPHAMMMPKPKGGENDHEVVRSWYGRMFLPSTNAFLPLQKKTFGEMRREMMSKDDDVRARAALSVCSPGLAISERLLLATCDEDEITCWGQCRKKQICSDPSDINLCLLDTGNGFVECSPNTHDSGCKPTCTQPKDEPGSDDGLDAIGNNFCSGFRVAMFMNGFTGVGDKNQECLVFLFQSFVLDSEMKFFFASLVACAMGVFTEFIVSLRRNVSKLKGVKPKRTKAMKVCLYALQIAFGYFAMLIAMTYSAVLFVMIVVGLTIGHVIFNFNTKVTENVDHCCPDPNDADTTDVEAASNKKPKVVAETKTGSCCEHNETGEKIVEIDGTHVPPNSN